MKKGASNIENKMAAKADCANSSLNKLAEPAAKAILTAAIDKLGLSARAYHRILKVARTLADRDLCDTVGRNHVLSALQFRRSLGDKMA
jgi:magnesium chelatase family protein